MSGPQQQVSETVSVLADQFEELYMVKGAFVILWQLAAEMQRRWEAVSPDGTPRGGPEAQQALSQFAVAHLLHQHQRLHDSALAYAKALAEHDGARALAAAEQEE